MKHAALMLGLVVLTLGCSQPQKTVVEDTEANRLIAAEHYLEISPVSQLLDDVSQEAVQNVPEQKRDEFVKTLKTEFRANVLEETMKKLLVKQFTVAELQALNEFYGSEAGRRASKKFGSFMDELRPVLRTELTRAAKAAFEHLAELSKQQQKDAPNSM